jgi:hypothetical protein
MCSCRCSEQPDQAAHDQLPELGEGSSLGASDDQMQRTTARIHSGIPSQCARQGLTAQLQPADICLTNAIHAPVCEWAICSPKNTRTQLATKVDED